MKIKRRIEPQTRMIHLVWCVAYLLSQTDGSTGLCLVSRCEDGFCDGRTCSSCVAGYYLEDSDTCTSCSYRCTKCTDYFSCEECHVGYYGYRCISSCTWCSGGCDIDTGDCFNDDLGDSTISVAGIAVGVTVALVVIGLVVALVLYLLHRTRKNKKSIPPPVSGFQNPHTGTVIQNPPTGTVIPKPFTGTVIQSPPTVSVIQNHPIVPVVQNPHVRTVIQNPPILPSVQQNTSGTSFRPNIHRIAPTSPNPLRQLGNMVEFTSNLSEMGSSFSEMVTAMGGTE